MSKKDNGLTCLEIEERHAATLGVMARMQHIFKPAGKGQPSWGKVLTTMVDRTNKTVAATDLGKAGDDNGKT